MEPIFRETAHAFDLGVPLSAEPVTGGLSNDLWKLATEQGSFAVKVMGVNADRPDFRDNIESAYVVERNAARRGVPMPEPLALPDGRCLTEAAGRLVRVHRWVDGRRVRPGEYLDEAGRLLAAIHQAGEESDEALDDEPWDVHAWASLADHPDMPEELAERLRRAAPELAALEKATAAPGLVTRHVPSHGDLDPKNTLVVGGGVVGGELMAVDWDAAGVQPCVREAVSLALDWSSDVTGFRRVLDSYVAASDAELANEPWVFGGWVAALGGWLVHNATDRIGTDVGRTEVTATCERLLMVQRSLGTYCAALPTNSASTNNAPTTSA